MGAFDHLRVGNDRGSEPGDKGDRRNGAAIGETNI